MITSPKDTSVDGVQKPDGISQERDMLRLQTIHLSPKGKQYIVKDVLAQLEKLLPAECTVAMGMSPDQSGIYYAVSTFGSIHDITDEIKDAAEECGLVLGRRGVQ